MPELVKKLLQPPRSSHHKKKKKNKDSAPEQTEKPLAPPFSPGTLPASLLSPPDPGPDQDHLPNFGVLSKKNRKLCTGRSQEAKKCHKDSQFSLTETPKTSTNGSPAPGTKLSNNESLRWEGELQDPQEEAKRLAVYRANRRKRYIAHREALSKETQHALKQTFFETC